MASAPHFIEDRVTDLFEGTRRRGHEIVTPEGVALRVEVAGRGERLGAFLLDILFFSIATALVYAAIAVLFAAGVNDEVATTLVIFLAFLIRLFYFIQFELAWRGRTPGKSLAGLRVIDRSGGALTASAIVARNLVREVEIFLPLGLFASLAATHGTQTWTQLATLGWVAAIALMPFFNRDHLRAGDLIAGTMVIAMPKRRLVADLATSDAAFTFTPRQLKTYGTFELQVLEEVLRQAPSPERARVQTAIAAKIRHRIGWTQEVAPQDVKRFLHAFYTAERADLESERLFGRDRLDKRAATR